jgi:hypothetical protein
MIRMFLSFLIVFLIFYCSINGYRALNQLERWRLTKVAAYSILCAVLATGFLMAIVILF